MTNEFLFILDKALIKAIGENKMKDAYELLEILYDHLTCNCFFSKTFEMVNGKLLYLTEKLIDNERNYENNVINGFVYLRIKSYDRSMHYLNNAIRLNKNNFLAYTLRSEIENSEIKLRIKDAEKSVALNPNQRNYFQLAKVQSKDDSTDYNLRKSIQLYQKAIDLNPHFACAINNQAILLKQIRDKESVILSCENNLKSNKKHWEREWLSRLYYEEGRYKEANKHLTYLVKAKPERIDFLLLLAKTQEYIGEEEKALSNYCKYYKVIQNVDSEEIVKPFTYNSLCMKFYELGGIMFKKKKNIEFKDLYEKFIKLEGYERWINGGMIRPDSYLSAILTLNKITLEDVDLHKYYYEELWSKYMNSSDKSKLTTEEKDIVGLKNYDMHDEISFGKYNGKTIIEIVDIDSNYLMRTILDSARFCVTNLIFMIEEVKEHPLFYEALAFNTAKNLFLFGREPETLLM